MCFGLILAVLLFYANCRMSFCMGSVLVLELSQLALSQPTSAGKALASNYFSTGSFFVYKTNSKKDICNSLGQPK